MFGHADGGLDSSEWAALYALSALAPEEKASFEQHVRNGCPACQAQVQAFQNVVSLIPLACSVAPPPSLREKLFEQVTGRARADSRGSGILFQQRGLLISRATELPWEPAAIPGVWSKTLWMNASRKYCTSLVRLDAETTYPPHRHNDIEEVYMLEGDFLVEGVQMRPGDYCRSEPGSIHGESKTESGVLLLVFSSQTDEILE